MYVIETLRNYFARKWIENDHVNSNVTKLLIDVRETRSLFIVLQDCVVFVVFCLIFHPLVRTFDKRKNNRPQVPFNSKIKWVPANYDQ